MAYKKVNCSMFEHSMTVFIVSNKATSRCNQLNLTAISQKRIGIIPTRHWFLDKSSTVHFIRASHAISCIRPTELIILLLNLWSAPSPAAPLLERQIIENVPLGPIWSIVVFPCEEHVIVIFTSVVCYCGLLISTRVSIIGYIV